MFFRLHTNIPNDIEENCIFEFGEQCNCVDVKNEKFCTLLHKNELTEQTLMLIPYEHILYIEGVEEDTI